MLLLRRPAWSSALPGGSAWFIHFFGIYGCYDHAHDVVLQKRPYCSESTDAVFDAANRGSDLGLILSVPKDNICAFSQYDKMDRVQTEKGKKWLEGSLKVLIIFAILGGITTALYFAFEDAESKTVETSTTSTAASTASSSSITASQEGCSDGQLKTINGNKCEDFDKNNCCDIMIINFTTVELKTGNTFVDKWGGERYEHHFFYDPIEIWYDYHTLISNTYDTLSYSESSKKWIIDRHADQGNANFEGYVDLTKTPSTYKGCPSPTDYYYAEGEHDWIVTCDYSEK